MKTIKIKSLKLTNFKGIRKLHLKELALETFIYGDNGTGKTTVFDAFTWLLFGKDSTDRKDFEIKTLDNKNNVIPKIDHEVEAVIEVDGENIEIRRIFREKWVKKRGSIESEFSGNETIYEWNGVPMNAGDFSTKIGQIVDEKVFKMITNPAAFNSLKWQDQRDVLIDMTGSISDQDIAKGNYDFENLLTKLVGKNLEEYKKQIKASISKSKKELQAIPTRIDEVERSKPEALDFEHVKLQLDKKNAEIEGVNAQISDKLKAQESEIEKQKAHQKEIHDIETEVNNKKHELQQEASKQFSENSNTPKELDRQINSIDREILENENTIKVRGVRIKSANHQVSVLDTKIKTLRENWEKENAKVFVMDESECACPTCKRAFDASDINEKKSDLEQYFISNKKANLNEINKKGQDFTAEKTALQVQISELETLNKDVEAKNKTLWEQRADLSEQLKALGELKSLAQIYTKLIEENDAFFTSKNEAIISIKGTLALNSKVDASELRAKLDELNKEKDAIKANLSKQDQIKAVNNRIAVLEKEESELAQGIADLEKDLFTIEAFEKEKSTRIETSVNTKFNLVNFKLFETQINGGEVPTCKALINGVPFSDANTASKINAGLDIINTLCQHYQANAPIFIDNRESVVELIPTESQIINLIVSEDDKKLRVEDRPLSYTEHVFKDKLNEANYEKETA